MGIKRKQHSAEFKARVAMAALSGEKTLAELSAEFGVHPTMISDWKQELVKRAGELFARGNRAPAVGDAQKVIDDLHRKIGQLQVERDFLGRAARHLPIAERRAMIAPEAGLSISRQCTLLGIARSSFYYRPRPESAEELELLKRLDRIFTDCPVYGSRRLQVALLREGISMGRRRVRRLMRKLGLWAVRPKRNTSKRHPGHKVYPYLLRDKTIDRANQVWAADITYIPMRQGFLYLVAIIDWATRRVLSWRLSNTLTAGFCVEALSEALARFGKPGIFNTDQGAQFTSDEFTKMLTDHGIAISMDGRGRCHDNIFVERLWWTVKHEWVYLRPAANGIEQKRSLGEFFDWYNLRRPHQALGWRTPDEAYLDQSTAATALAA
ncbi:MAG TPA: IS3 family transposase [Candidatus Angelobacter sp.]|nr:IS3 family transposase [Candidatus Angelobacter sp.]